MSIILACIMEIQSLTRHVALSTQGVTSAFSGSRGFSRQCGCPSSLIPDGPRHTAIHSFYSTLCVDLSFLLYVDYL